MFQHRVHWRVAFKTDIAGTNVFANPVQECKPDLSPVDLLTRAWFVSYFITVRVGGLRALLLENNSVGARVADMPPAHSETERMRKLSTGRINTIPQRVCLIKKHPVPEVQAWEKFPFGMWQEQRDRIRGGCHLLAAGHIAGPLHLGVLWGAPCWVQETI